MDACKQYSLINEKIINEYYESFVDDETTTLKIISCLQPRFFSNTFKQKDIKYNEFADLLTQTRNDFLYFIYCAKMEPAFIRR